MSDQRLRWRQDALLIVAGWLAALLFGLFSLAMLLTVGTASIKESEVLVVTVFTSGCLVAFIASCLLLVRSYRWALWVSGGAMVASIGCYLFEADLRTEETHGFALVLIGLPMFLGLLVAGGYAKSAAKRAAKKLPPAQVHD